MRWLMAQSYLTYSRTHPTDSAPSPEHVLHPEEREVSVNDRTPPPIYANAAHSYAYVCLTRVMHTQIIEAGEIS